MREYKKLWKKDKRFYLITILTISLFTLILFGKSAYSGYGTFKEIAIMQLDGYEKIATKLDEYVEEGIYTEESFYAEYTVLVDNERLIKIENFGGWFFSSAFDHVYINILIFLFIMQSIRFSMSDSKRKREFMSVLPIRKRSYILHEWFSGMLLYTIPMFTCLIPAGIYTYAIHKFEKENHCFVIKGDYDFTLSVIFAGWVSLLFLYTFFILMRYLTNSLAANYVVGIFISSIPFAILYTLESVFALGLNDSECFAVDALLNNTGILMEELPWSFMPMNMAQAVIEILIPIAFLITTIFFAEKCKKEVNGMFAHKAVKILFLAAIYIWSFLFIFSSTKTISPALISILSILGAGAITGGAGYLVRAR